MDLEVTEKFKLLPVHKHPLLPFTRFHHGTCRVCFSEPEDYIYGGYICNELGCNALFHSSCAESAPEISHYSHPNHTLKLLHSNISFCSLCENVIDIGYFCSICDFKLDLVCARKSTPSPLVDFKVHDHPLRLSDRNRLLWGIIAKTDCEACDIPLGDNKSLYHCLPCNFIFHVECVEFFPEGYHISHPKHPLKFLKDGPPDYSDKKCLLCEGEFEKGQLFHCDVCNFSICGRCVRNPPPYEVISATTHKHTLHIVPRIIDFTCNACGTKGDRSPYFCLQCNFMIHRDCIDLPRVININHHDHRISYTSHLGHGKGKSCGVCRKNVDGFYGGYSCSKCPIYVVHSRCATKYNIWDKLELEGTPEEEETEPFEVIDDQTIKHFSHDHILKFNKDGNILQESILCEACLYQICDDPFYSCHECDFILHETCANLRPKKRHVSQVIPFTLQVDSTKNRLCHLCGKYSSGFKYISDHLTLDVRCGSFTEPFFHKSHPHPLFYKHEKHKGNKITNFRDQKFEHMLCCDECPFFTLSFQEAFLPKKIMSKRYDDHPLFLSYGENNVNSTYWCEVCETKLDPKKWFYTCVECGITLHVSCIVGEFSFHNSKDIFLRYGSCTSVVANTSVCRPKCSECDLRCMLPFMLKEVQSNVTSDLYSGADSYFCSENCQFRFTVKKDPLLAIAFL